MKEIGKKYNATAGRFTLAWILSQGEDNIPIPGTTRLAVRPVSSEGQPRIISDDETFIEPEGKYRG